MSTVSSDGEVSKKGAKLTSLQLVGEEVSYNADLNQDGIIKLLPAGNRADYGLDFNQDESTRNFVIRQSEPKKIINLKVLRTGML